MSRLKTDSDISRRGALVTIGQAAITLGLASSVPAETTASAQLPPGLYQPSSNHLGHALMSSGRFHPVPTDCPTDYIRPRTEPFAPLFFSPAEFTAICRIIQLMLGEVGLLAMQEVAEWIDLCVASSAAVRAAAQDLNTLHRALAVAYFGSDKVTQIESSHPEKICREGLAWVADAARRHGTGQFVSLTEQQQFAILESISDERSGGGSENPGTRLFAFVKAEVIRGYYTSQAGLKELDFKGNAFYARSPGCNLPINLQIT